MSSMSSMPSFQDLPASPIPHALAFILHPGGFAYRALQGGWLLVIFYFKSGHLEAQVRTFLGSVLKLFVYIRNVDAVFYNIIDLFESKFALDIIFEIETNKNITSQDCT